MRADGDAVALANRNAVSVSGSTVTLTLASSIRAGQTVTVSYTKGTNPILATDGDVAANLANRAASLAGPALSRAVVSRNASPWKMTVELDQRGLLGSFIASAWSVRADGGAAVRPTGGSIDAVAGTVTLTLPASLSWDDTLTLSYRLSGSASTRLRNAAGNPLASFSGKLAEWSRPPNAACTLGPGPDPWNPDNPCGTHSKDISTAVDAYKSTELMTAAELTDPPEPDSVAIECSSPNDPDPDNLNNRNCVITWQRPCTDAAAFVTWAQCRHWPEGYVASFVFNAYLFADLKAKPDSTCNTPSVLLDRFPGLKPAETQTRSDFDIDTDPPNLPAGCTIKRWVASVVIEQGTSGGKSSGAAFVKRDP